jgi:hypothetical protein
MPGRASPRRNLTGTHPHIMVLAAEGHQDRDVLIDGYKHPFAIKCQN